MNKKIVSGIIIGVILLSTIIIGRIFWLQKNQTSITTAPQITKDSKQTINNTVISNYGFNFSVPVGWHIWEGSSAASELMARTAFLTDFESGLTTQKAKEYQSFMDNWKPESSDVIDFVNSETIDYSDRNLAKAGKIMSRSVDSKDILKQREVLMTVSNSEVNLTDEFSSDKNKESRNIKINGKDARLLISKKMKTVDVIIIRMPINSNKTINGRKVSSLTFFEYVRKNDPSAINKLTSFISSLDISIE